MSKDYTDVGLDSQLRSATGLVSRKGEFVSGQDFDFRTESGAVKTVHLRDASISNAKMGTAVIGTANIGTLSFNEITGGTAILGGTANGDGVLIVRNEAGEQRIIFDKSDMVFSLGAGIGWGTPGEVINVAFGASGGIGGTVNLEHNGLDWKHHIEDSTYLVNCVDGTIELNINNLSQTTLLRIKSGSGTIAELDSSGNLNIAGALGTGVSF